MKSKVFFLPAFLFASATQASAFLPFACALHGGWFYRRVVFIWASLAIALVAGIWLAERALDVKLWP